MAQNVIPFNENSNLPAHISKLFGGASNSAYASAGGSLPAVSFRGKVWRIVKDGEETVVTVPDSEDPATTLEVVLLKGNPNRSKTYYGDKKYVEGEQTEPLCASRDGIVPDDGVQDKQCDTCAACHHNVWGSKISENGKKVKACADSKRIAVVPAGDLEFSPLKLSVPAASLTDKDNKENEGKGWYALSEYAKMLEKRGVPVEAVVTKIGFDSRPAFPKLLFKAVGYLSEDQAAKVVELRDSDEVNEIVGLDFERKQPVKEAEKPAAKPKPVKAKPAEDDAPPAAKAKPVVEDDAPPVTKAAPVPTKVVDETEPEVADSALKDKVASILGSLSLDDDDEVPGQSDD